MYKSKTTKKENKQGQWASTLVEIFHNEEKIGEYLRNYPSHGEKTFAPFQQNGKWFALYSDHYEKVSIMEFPSCKKIGELGEHFCPVEIWVPRFSIRTLDYTKQTGTVYPSGKVQAPYEYMRIYEHQGEFNPDDSHYLTYAFTQGCVWGDDSSWKLSVIDLEKASEGKLEYLTYVPDDKEDEKPLMIYNDLIDGELKNLIRIDNGFDISENKEEVINSRFLQFEAFSPKTYRLRGNGKPNWLFT